MRRPLALTAAVVLAACGGKEKNAGTTPIAGAGAGGDMHIPKVDSSLCDTAGKKVVTFDLNQDGKPDVWKLYTEKEQKGTKVEILTCKQVDLDHDGRKDYVVQFDDSGTILVEDFDFDFDGKFDARVHWDKKTGNKYLVERVTNFGGKVDAWEKYDGLGRLEDLRRDRNGDGKPDYWEQYQNGVLMKILFDDDYDGRVDRQEEAQARVQPAPAPVPASQPVPATTH